MVKEGYKDTEVGVIPVEWKICKLENISKIVDSLHITPSFVESGISMVRVSDIKSGELNLDDTLKVTEDTFITFTKNYTPKKDDIVLSRVGSYGVSSYVSTDELFCMGQNTVVINPSINSRFVYYYLNSIKIFKQIEIASYGSGYKSLSLKNIKELKLSLPPLKEQEKIADILSTSDDKIDAIASQIQKAETLKKGLLQKLLSEGLGHSEFKDSELGKIPESWEITTVGKSSKNFDGQRVPLKSEDRQEIQGDYPYYGAQGIIDYVNDYIFDGRYLLVAEDGENVKGQKYDIAFVVSGQFWVNNHAHILQANDNMDLYFISSVLNHTNIIKYVTGTGQPKLNKAQLNSIKIPLPPFEEQKQIADILSTADEKLEVLRVKKEKYETLKKGLMQKLLSGEVRVGCVS